MARREKRLVVCIMRLFLSRPPKQFTEFTASALDERRNPNRLAEKCVEQWIEHAIKESHDAEAVDQQPI